VPPTRTAGADSESSGSLWPFDIRYSTNVCKPVHSRVGHSPLADPFKAGLPRLWARTVARLLGQTIHFGHYTLTKKESDPQTVRSTRNAKILLQAVTSGRGRTGAGGSCNMCKCACVIIETS